MNHGVYVTEQATSVSTPVVAKSGVPFVVGCAPVQSAASPAKLNMPVLCTNWDEAVEMLGYSNDWEKYPLCEFMYSHFKLFGCQPVIFCNTLNVSKTNPVRAAEKPVADHKVKLPIHAIASTVVVQKSESSLEKGTDYETYYADDALVIELLSSSDAYADRTLNVAYSEVTAAVTETDIATGIESIELCLTKLGVTPDLICAPGWSHDNTVAAAMVAKADSINGLFKAKALVDIDCDSTTTHTAAIEAKKTNNMTASNQIVCWPMLSLGNLRFHASTQVAGLMAMVDTNNGGCPYESPSNKNLRCDGTCLKNGNEVALTIAQANELNAAGIVTALNFVNGWVAWGSYTGCYPASTDVKDYMIPISRMFDWVGNTLIKTFWSKLDKPMTSRLLDTVLDTCNIWLNGLVGQGYLMGARVEMIEAENDMTSLMAGIVKLHIYMTPPGPAQEIDFVLEFDPEYVSSAFAS